MVLRVGVDVLSQRKKALTLKDCECIGVKVSEIVNGDTIALERCAFLIMRECRMRLSKIVIIRSKKVFDYGRKNKKLAFRSLRIVTDFSGR